MDTIDLLDKYIGICNLALDANKDKFPFKYILSAASRNNNLKLVNAIIIDNKAELPFKFKLIDSHLNYELSECESDCGKCCGGCGLSNSVWKLDVSYICNVINNPSEYINNPAKLNWEWLNEN